MHVRAHLGFLLVASLAIGGPASLLAAGRALPLLEAAKAADAAAVRALLEQRADVHAAGPDGTTALHWAAHHGDLPTIEALLSAGARVTTANRYGVTPLVLAAASGNGRVVARLLRAGADANTAVTGGETVLMTAARMGRADAVRALIEKGADVNAREGTRGQTALMWAAAEGHADVVRALIQGGGDVKAISRAPAAIASDPTLTDGSSIDKRVAPRVDRFTPLQFAVRAGHVEAVRALLDAGADVNDETPQAMSTLVLAIANAHFELAALLLDRGADPNVARTGFTPLHQLVRVRTLNIGQFPHPTVTGAISSLELAKILIDRGAAVDARTTKGWSDGFRGGFGLDATPFLIAAKGGDAQMMQLLAANGADVTAVNRNGTTAIMAAAGVEMFNPNEDSGTDAEGLAALKVGIALGAGDVNAVNKRGDAALHGAIHRPSTAIIQFLVDNGARMDLKNGKGLTPIQLAATGVGVGDGLRPEAVALLRELMVARGLNPDVKEDKDRYSFGVKVR